MNFISITHKKPECIGCGLCAETAPGYWQMDENGEAQLVAVIRKDAQFEYANGFIEDRLVLELTEEGCPVDVIRIG